MKRKINLTENEIRKIVRRVILRNENPFLFEVEEKKDAKEQEKEGAPDKPVKEYKYEDLIKKTGDTDNLAIKTTGTADRAIDIAQGATTATGVAAGLGGIFGAISTNTLSLGAVGAGAVDTLAAVSAGLVSGPVGWSILGVAAVAGLYYMFGPETTSTAATKEALDTTLYDRVYTGFENIYRELSKSEFEEIRNAAERINPKVCLDVPKPDEATKIAERIYQATQGSGSSYLSTALGAISGGYLAGAGTDEAGIEKALKSCKSYLGVSLVSKKHAKMYEGVIDDGDLHKVFTGELDNADMERYVDSVIETLPYIIINNKSFSKQEFQDWLIQNKKAADELLQKLKEDLENKEEEEEDLKNTEPVEPPFVELIQKSMNKYCSQNGLEYDPIAEDNKWGPKTEALWSKTFVPHVFSNHPVFSQMNISIENSKWSNLSRQLIKDYPGYTSGSKGCARFCVDALYGNTIQGEKEGTGDSPIKYFKGGGGSRGKRKVTPEPERGVPEEAEKEKTSYQPLGDGRLTYRNIKIDVDTVGDRNIRKLSELPGAPADADDELKYDFLTNFGTGRLDIPPGETFQLHIMPKKNGKIKLKHKSTKLFKTLGIRTFADPFYRFFLSLNLSDANIKKLTMDGKTPIILKIIMPGGLYNPAVER